MDKAHIHVYWDHSNLFARMGATCDDGKGTVAAHLTAPPSITVQVDIPTKGYV